MIKKQRKQYKIACVRSPTLQTVHMVERFIEKESGKYRKTGIFKSLPKKVMWQTFQVIISYLESIHKISYHKGYVFYIWNHELRKEYANKPDFELSYIG